MLHIDRFEVMASAALMTRSSLTDISRTRLSDDTRTRRQLAPRSMEERKKLQVTKHPDERGQSRKLLTDPDCSATMISRPRNGCCWSALGAALRQYDDRPIDRTCPYLVNHTWDCFELTSAYPEFSAVGCRALLPRMKNRFTFEFRNEASGRQHIAQVGIARIGSDCATCLDESTELLDSVVYTSGGDLISTTDSLEILAPGGLPGLRPRLENWCSGAPKWLSSDGELAHVMMEVDLLRGRIALSLGHWAIDPIVLHVPALVEGDVEEKQWLPFVSLTAAGHSARILDFHTCFEA